MAERDFEQQLTTEISPAEPDEWQEAGEEEVPSAVLYAVAGLLLLAFTIYLVAGGGHGHFH